MSSISSTEFAYWENKELDAWFGPAVLDFEQSSEATSFFDLRFEQDQDAFDSSDASVSVEFGFFDDIDLTSTSTNPSVFSTTADGPSKTVGDCGIYSMPSTASQTAQGTPLAAIPQIQKLVHRLRPEGIAISSADLLSIEGKQEAPLNRAMRPKTPTTVQQPKSGAYPSKTPRTPEERGSRISKAAKGSMRSPRKTMHPSNYYASPQTPSMRQWQDRINQFDIQRLPLTPPSSTKFQEKAHHGSPLTDSPTPASTMPAAGCMSSPSPLPAHISMHQSGRESLERDANHLAPLAAWTDAASSENPFSPLSPAISDVQWDANTVAHVQNGHFEPFSATSSLVSGGLMIDFGDTNNFLRQPLDSQPFSDDYDLSLPSSMSSFTMPTFDLQQDSTAPFPDFQTSSYPARALTPSPKSHSRPLPPRMEYSSRTFPRTKRQTPSILPPSQYRHVRTGTGASTISTSRSTSSHRRTHSANAAAVKSSGMAKPKLKTAVQGPGDMFVNFTPSDSRRILTGVAPSGSSKTKARREKEAREDRRRMSEAARRAVMQAGGDWEGLEGLVGEGGQRREVEC